MSISLRWLIRHPTAALSLARGANFRDLVLREDLRRIGIPLTVGEARGLGDGQLAVRVVTRLREKLSDSPPRTLIDVGAARGSFALAAMLAFPGLEVFSFEPLGDEFAVLEKVAATRPRLHAFRTALGDEAGSTVIHVSRSPGCSSLMPMLPALEAAFPGTARVREETIEVRTLDDVVAKESIDLTPPVLLKLDVQGFEDRVLAGAAGTLSRIDTMIVEMSLEPLYEGQVTSGDLRGSIESAGFRWAGEFDEIRSPVSGRLVQMDGLFRRGRAPARG